jgi:NAD(P)H-hydrate epimerase
MNALAVKTLAVDIPSGISADTGEILGAAVRADATVTFAYNKRGLTLDPGKALAGKLIIADIGIYASR